MGTGIYVLKRFHISCYFWLIILTIVSFQVKYYFPPEEETDENIKSYLSVYSYWCQCTHLFAADDVFERINLKVEKKIFFFSEWAEGGSVTHSYLCAV